MSYAVASTSRLARLRDYVELGKPRLSTLVIFTAAIGVWLAPGGIGFVRTAVFLVATSVLVAAANTLNCWIEKELDALMERTRDRPLPAGRMAPRNALVSGLTLSVFALTALAVTTNSLTTALGAIALVSYALVYTPLKRFTPWALVVGAVPGAMPPLMGWTAATNTLALPGWFAFGILFFWQLPHFAAISIYLKEDFDRAGFKVLALVYGDAGTRRAVFGFTVLMVAWSLLAQPFGIAGTPYTIAAALLGAAFIAVATPGLYTDAANVWARRTFMFTLFYLPLLVTALVLDRL